MPAWEFIKLPQSPLKSIACLGQTRISDDILITLGEENDPSHNKQGGTSLFEAVPKVRNFFALDLNTMECWKIKNEVNMSPNFIQRPGPYQLLLEGNDILVCSLSLRESPSFIVWRLSLSRDYSKDRIKK